MMSERVNEFSPVRGQVPAEAPPSGAHRPAVDGGGVTQLRLATVGPREPAPSALGLLGDPPPRGRKLPLQGVGWPAGVGG